MPCYAYTFEYSVQTARSGSYISVTHRYSVTFPCLVLRHDLGSALDLGIGVGLGLGLGLGAGVSEGL